VWHGNPWFVLIAAFCGGAIAVATHTTKLGVRYILETAATRRLTLVADLGEGVFVLLLIVMMQKWPAATVLIALGVLCAVLLLVRLIWRTLLQVFTGRWTPACGLLQAPRLGTHERELSDEYID
jgi:hypothetical protein